MQNNHPLSGFLYKHSYLLIIAAWLITLSFIIDNYWSGNSSIDVVRSKLEKYVQKQEKDFDQLMEDTVLVNKINDNSYDESLLKKLTKKKYFLYRYFINDIGLYQLIFWNTQAVLPSPYLVSSPDSSGFVQLENGYYAWRKINTPSSITVALIPVKWNYFITNVYLKNTFATGEGFEVNYDVSEEPGNTVVRSSNGKRLFSLVERSSNTIPKNNLIAAWLRILAAIFVLLYIHLFATQVAANRGLPLAILFLIIVVFILRLLSYFFPFPLNFRQFELFDPSIYGSNAVLRSLGDLLINSALFTWIVLFIHYHLQETDIIIRIKKPWGRWLAVGVICILLLAATF